MCELNIIEVEHFSNNYVKGCEKHLLIKGLLGYTTILKVMTPFISRSTKGITIALELILVGTL